MRDRRRFRESLRTALQQYDSHGLAKLFELTPIASETEELPEPCKTEPLLVNGVDYGPVFASLVNANDAAAAGRPARCFQEQANVHNHVSRVFASSEGNWLVPTVWIVCKNTRRAATKADQEASDKIGKNAHTNLEKAVSMMRDSFSKAFNDRTEFVPDAPFDLEGSKKAAVLGIVNELFQSYFILNNLRLCKNLIKPVQMRKLDQIAPMGQLVTYKYFVGRLSLFEDQHASAEENLDFAFRHCHKNSFGNKRRILQYLIPIKLLRGRLPAPYLLTKYRLNEFEDLVQATRKGDLKTFQEAIIAHQDKFICQGTYLLLEKCKTVCHRNLLKRIAKVLDRHQISLGYVARAFKYLGMSIDLDEVECILANLIYRGYVRGYLSHAKRVLVLSKRDPFPFSAVVSQ